MRVGVDLDNTLICYDEPFLAYAHKLQLIPDSWAGKKNEIRQYIMSQTDGEDHWQKLQGLVYSKGILEACLFPGVYRFLWRCNIREITVEVVSHKTEFGHFDKDGVLSKIVNLNYLYLSLSVICISVSLFIYSCLSKLSFIFKAQSQSSIIRFFI